MKIFFAFFCFLLCIPVIQQLPDPIGTIKLKNANYLTIDQFGNIYTVQFDQLKKFDTEGKEVFAYSNPLLGSIEDVSAFDPMNLLLFYKDQAQITSLDNRLIEKTALKFSDYGLSDVQLISQSDENNIWAYDQSTDRLYRLNKSRASVSNKSLNISQIINKENTPIQLESTYDKVYLNIPQEGILIFDATGSLIRTLAIKNIDHFTLIGKTIFASIEENIFKIDLQTNKQTLMYCPEQQIISLAASEKKLYVLLKNNLHIYSIQN